MRKAIAFTSATVLGTLAIATTPLGAFLAAGGTMI